jgi:hypothetical protein
MKLYGACQHHHRDGAIVVKTLFGEDAAAITRVPPPQTLTLKLKKRSPRAHGDRDSPCLHGLKATQLGWSTGGGREP